MTPAEEKAELKELFKLSVITFKFLKADGTEREMTGTLSEYFLPDEEIGPNKPKRKENDEVLAVWDIDKEAFRSFRIDSVTSLINAIPVHPAIRVEGDIYDFI